MSLPTATTKIIAAGAWAQVRVKQSSSDALQVIGLCTDASYDESFNLQDANVLGHLGPVSIDSQGYKCSIKIGTFVPEVKSDSGYPDGGDTTLSDLLPTRSQVMLDGKGKTFAYLDFYNLAKKTVINAFSMAIIGDDGARMNPNNYITNNISLQSIERTV
jgi:hypothetical protein